MVKVKTKNSTKIIVGLGNPGDKYSQGRHNIGFMVVEALNKKYDGNFKLDKKLYSELSEIKINNKDIILAKPKIFVNNSGKAVKKILSTLKFKESDLIVVHDDLDIPFNKIKISFGKNSGGHKGVQSIIDYLKTNSFHRLRIGTFNNELAKIKKGKNKRKKIVKINKFVIDKFSLTEQKRLNIIIKRALEMIEKII